MNTATPGTAVRWRSTAGVGLADFSAFGAPDTFKAAVMVAVFAIPAVLGAVLMLIPQRRAAMPAPAR